MSSKPFALTVARCLTVCCALLTATVAAAFDVGFGSADISPPIVEGKPIWLAGLEQNRAATGVHDKLWARAIVLRSRKQKIALVSADSIGIPYPIVQQVRKKLRDFKYVLVASTHSHATPDVVGIWGPAADKSGVVPEYIDLLEQKIVEAVRKADAASAPGTAEYGIAEDESLLGDFRLPEVYDGVLRAVRFQAVGKKKPCGILVQWNAHGIEPSNNPLVTRDFMGSMVDALEARHGCPVVYFQGAIGGLMGTPKKVIEQAKAGEIPSDTFGFMNALGEITADLADRALAGAEPISLEPFEIHAKPIMIPLDNPGFVQAVAAGVLKRPVFQWLGDRDQPGEEAPADKVLGRPVAMETEVAYLLLGELHIAAIPGELYPECVYGKYQDPADPGADFPDAPLEPPIASILPPKKMLVLGLANDLVGYIIPKRQWDVKPPFAYDRKSAQYGERNSVGPETAGHLLGALADRAAESLGDTSK
jgi:hypothetical protein